MFRHQICWVPFSEDSLSNNTERGYQASLVFLHFRSIFHFLVHAAKKRKMHQTYGIAKGNAYFTYLLRRLQEHGLPWSNVVQNAVKILCVNIFLIMIVLKSHSGVNSAFLWHSSFSSFSKSGNLVKQCSQLFNPPLTFKSSWNTFLSTGDVQTCRRNGIVASSL